MVASVRVASNQLAAEVAGALKFVPPEAVVPFTKVRSVVMFAKVKVLYDCTVVESDQKQIRRSMSKPRFVIAASMSSNTRPIAVFITVSFSPAIDPDRSMPINTDRRALLSVEMAAFAGYHARGIRVTLAHISRRYGEFAVQ